MLIGKKLRALRKTRHMTLKELSDKSGVQMATLSRIENEKMTGTLESHMQIAKALEVNITDLYEDIQLEDKTVDFKDEKAEADVFAYNDKSSYEILTSKVLNKKMMPILLKIEPEGRTNKEQNKTGTEKFVFVLDGKIEIYINEEPYSLGKQNTLYFDASLPHRFVNTGKNTARVICVVTPVAL